MLRDLLDRHAAERAVFQRELEAVADELRAFLLWTVGQTAAAVWGLLVAGLLGVASVGLAPAAALVLGVAGAVQAESSGWLVRPWTWLVRGQLPLLGVHGNSVNLDPGDPAWGYASWPSMALTAAVGAVGLLLLLGAGRTALRRPRRPRSSAATVAGATEVEPPRPAVHEMVRPWDSPVAGASRRPASSPRSRRRSRRPAARCRR